MSDRSATILLTAAISVAVFALWGMQLLPLDARQLNDMKARYISNPSPPSVFVEQSSDMASKPIMSSRPILLSDKQTSETMPRQMPSRIEESLQSAQVSPTAFLLFKNASYGVQIKYPMDWQVLEGDRNRFDGIVDIVRFISPLENSSDVYQERVRLSIDSLPPENMSLGQYVNGVISYKNETLDNFSLSDRNDDSNILFDSPAYRLIYTRTLDHETVIKDLEIGTKIDDKIYYLLYSAEEGKYVDLLPLIHDMIESLELS